MTTLNLVTGFLYSIVRETWLVTAVMTKYLLLANLGAMAYQRELTWESFRENLLEYGKPVLLGFTVLGTALHISGFSITPVFNFFSQLIAVTSLGYLFYKY